MTQLSDGLEKAMAIHEMQGKWYRDYFIETGTADATTFNAVAQLNQKSTSPFLFMYTIENDHPRYLNSVERMAGVKDTVTIYADSGVHLQRMMQRVHGSFLFFLDAHGAEPDEPTPILKELEHILWAASLVEHHKPIIMIDDARLFEDWATWPSISELEQMWGANAYHFDVQDDIIRMEPNGSD